MLEKDFLFFLVLFCCAELIEIVNLCEVLVDFEVVLNVGVGAMDEVGLFIDVVLFICCRV